MEEKINELAFYHGQLKEKASQLSRFKLNMIDIYIYGALFRSNSLIDGFLELVKRNNFVSAVPFVRLHLDSLLRLYAPSFSELDFDEFANKVIIDETEIRKLNSRFKTPNSKLQPLTDDFLARKLSEQSNFSWVLKLYKAANGFVHYSYKHVFASLKTMENNIVQLAFDNSDFIPEKEKIGVVIYMTEITKAIICISDIWIENRNNQ